MKNEKYYTYKLNMGILNFLAIVLFIIVGLFVYIIERNDPYTIHCDVGELFILMFFLLIVHEFLHAIGFSIFKKVERKNITFGMYLEKGVFYCMCKQKIGKKIILTSLLFPVTIIGIITLGIGMILNHYELVFLSLLNIASSIGDLLMALYFLASPQDITYLDLDDCTSFTVVSKENLEKIKIPGINLIETGIYIEDKMKAKDKRKLVISKASYLLIVIIIVLIIIKIVGD